MSIVKHRSALYFDIVTRRAPRTNKPAANGSKKEKLANDFDVRARGDALKYDAMQTKAQLRFAVENQQ